MTPSIRFISDFCENSYYLFFLLLLINPYIQSCYFFVLFHHCDLPYVTPASVYLGPQRSNQLYLHIGMCGALTGEAQKALTVNSIHSFAFDEKYLTLILHYALHCEVK
jgi:hypothetical protein